MHKTTKANTSKSECVAVGADERTHGGHVGDTHKTHHRVRVSGSGSTRKKLSVNEGA